MPIAAFNSEKAIIALDFTETRHLRLAQFSTARIKENNDESDDKDKPVFPVFIDIGQTNALQAATNVSMRK